MTQARYFDGKVLGDRQVDIIRDGDRLRFEVGSIEHVWPLTKLEVEPLGRDVRLSCKTERDARLVLSAQDWRNLSGAFAGELVRRRERGRAWLLSTLVCIAASTLLFVFVGVPAASGPLARRTPPELETRLGDNLDRQMGGFMPPCEGEEGQRILAELGTQIASGTDSPFDIRVQAVQAPMVNAMALPGGRIWVTDDLIREARSADELSAVIAHEIAHVKQRHVMQAVYRSLGIGMVLDAVVGGGSGAGQQAVILAGNATELSYGRRDETEADAHGQALLHAQGLSSRGMASFFEHMEESSGREMEDRATEFASSHPNTHRRAAVARAAERPGRSALTEEQWARVRATCSAVDYPELEDIRRRVEPRAPANLAANRRP